jgi:hypothetical protein
MQAFTDLVGTSAVPAHAFDITELTELTPALDTAQAAHGTAEQASEAGWHPVLLTGAGTFTAKFCGC